jgi:hypothetical protein
MLGLALLNKQELTEGIKELEKVSLLLSFLLVQASILILLFLENIKACMV